MNNLMTTNINQEQTMSSREIAELTGKRHGHVLRDIRDMVEALNSDDPNKDYQQNQGLTSIPCPQTKRVQEYLLNRDLTYCLLTGYSAKLRMIVIERWQELEVKTKVKLPATFAEALQLAADQAKALELAAPKVNHYDKVVNRDTLLNATQVGQKVGMTAVKLNRVLDELDVYNKSSKRGRVFKQWWVDKGLGKLKEADTGHTQALFTTKGSVWVVDKFTNMGIL